MELVESEYEPGATFSVMLWNFIFWGTADSALAGGGGRETAVLCLANCSFKKGGMYGNDCFKYHNHPRVLCSVEAEGKLDENRRRVNRSREVITMGNNTVVENNETRILNADRVLKVTALQYLKEALCQERYEDCAELVRAAKLFGAQPDDIRVVLTGFARVVMGAPEKLVVVKRIRARRF